MRRFLARLANLFRVSQAENELAREIQSHLRLLARTADRQKEIAVRVALGAGKARLVAQFLTDHLLLAGIRAVIGLLLAAGGIRALVLFSPADIPRLETVAIDGRALLFLTSITVLTALIFGLIPAMHAAAGNLSEALKEGGRGDTDGRSRNRLRSCLVASEFALAFMLLIGAGLMARSFYALQSVDTGFNPHNVSTMVVSVAGTAEAAPGRRRTFYRDLLDKVKTLPGVRAVGGINHLPLAGDLWTRGFEIEDRPRPLLGETPGAVYRIVMPGYFDAMRLPIRRGRAITSQDDAKSEAVVIINERASNKFWPGGNPIGKRIAIRDRDIERQSWLRIIGVTANASLDDMVTEPYPEIYLAALQTPAFMGEGSDPASLHMTYLTLVAGGDGDPAKLATQMLQVVQSFDRNLPVSQVLTMDEAVSVATAEPRFEMMLLGLFAAVALVLAAVGIYGVMNYAVAKRTREIGIRMSIGAGRREIFRMVILQAIRQALAGTLVGVVGAIMLSRLITKMLFGVQPNDPLTFVGVTMILGLAVLLATAIPARKAIQIEPMMALRSE